MAKTLKPRIRMKIIIFDIMKIICVISILIISIQTIPSFFKHQDVTQKTEIVSVPKKNTVDGKKGSIDILGIGNSNLYSAFNPLQIWKEYGFTSFVGSAPQQNMCLSYYMLKEILTVQNPKVLLLEVNNIFENRGNTAVKENLQLTYTYCYPVFRDTDRWQEIKSKGVVQTKKQSFKLVTRGFYYSTKVVPNPKGMYYMKPSSDTEPISPFTKTYLPKIMSLAKQNNIKVFFTCFPSETSWTYQKHNTVKKIAEEYDLDFIDFNIEDYGTGFDWNTDSRDGGNHLNYSGATKMTKYLGEYINDNYELSDYRGKKNYTDWDEDYDIYIKKIKE